MEWSEMMGRILVPHQYDCAEVFGPYYTGDQSRLQGKVIMGYKIPEFDTLVGESDEETAQLQQHAAYLLSKIPLVKPGYKLRPDLLMEFGVYWTQHAGNGLYVSGADPKFMYLKGPKGAGKSSLVKQIFGLIGIPTETFDGHAESKEYHLKGKTALSGGSTFEEYGPLALAMRYGIPLIFEEADRTRGLLVSLNGVADGNPIRIGTETVFPEPGFCVFLTGNTNMSSPEPQYNAARPQDAAVIDRLFTIEVSYCDIETERQMISDGIAELSDDVLAAWFEEEGLKVSTASGLKEGEAVTRSEFVDALVNLYRNIRQQSIDGGSTDDAALEATVSHRQGISLLQSLKASLELPSITGESALHKAFAWHFTNGATESTRLAIHEMVTATFGIPRIRE
jgi:MoxR-like ATPase